MTAPQLIALFFFFVAFSLWTALLIVGGKVENRNPPRATAAANLIGLTLWIALLAWGGFWS